MPLIRQTEVIVPGLSSRYLRDSAKMEGFARHAALQFPRFLSWGAQWTDLVGAIPLMTSVNEWTAQWQRLGEIYLQDALTLRETQALGSARQAFALAALYYHFACIFLPAPDEQRLLLVEKSIQAYEEAGALSPLPPLRLEIPYEQGFLAGYLWPAATATPAPTVILLHGGDSGKAEMLRWVDDLVSKGLSVFSVDMPGQGEAVTRHLLRITQPAKQAPIFLRAIIDTLLQRPEVDASRLALAGECLGGFMGLLGASAQPQLRVAAFVAPRIEPNLSQRSEQETNQRIWETVVGNHEPWDYDLPGALQTLHIPLLIAAGRDDRTSPAAHWQEWLPHTGGPAELLQVIGGTSVLINAWAVTRPAVSDWLKQRLAVTPRA